MPTAVALLPNPGEIVRFSRGAPRRRRGRASLGWRQNPRPTPVSKTITTRTARGPLAKKIDQRRMTAGLEPPTEAWRYRKPDDVRDDVLGVRSGRTPNAQKNRKTLTIRR